MSVEVKAQRPAAMLKNGDTLTAVDSPIRLIDWSFLVSDVTLYDRDPKYIPRVAAVHDMCGYGKCSLTAARPR